MIFFKGATAWEFQIWRFYVTVPFWRYLRNGCPVIMGYQWKDWSD